MPTASSVKTLPKAVPSAPCGGSYCPKGAHITPPPELERGLELSPHGPNPNTSHSHQKCSIPVTVPHPSVVDLALRTVGSGLFFSDISKNIPFFLHLLLMFPSFQEHSFLLYIYTLLPIFYRSALTLRSGDSCPGAWLTRWWLLSRCLLPRWYLLPHWWLLPRCCLLLLPRWSLLSRLLTLAPSPTFHSTCLH